VTRFERNGKTGTTATAVSNSVLALLFVFLYPAVSFAERFWVEGTIGTLFDSNIEHLSIVDLLTMGERRGVFLRNAALGGAAFGRDDAFSASVSLAAETGLDVPERSRLNSYADVGWHLEPRSDISLDLAFGLHHTAEDFLAMRNMFLDVFATGDLFWDIEEAHAWYGALKAGYYLGFDEEMRYLTGPMFAFENGYFHYPTDATDYVKPSVGIEGYFFRPEVLSSCEGTLSVNNSFIKPTVGFEGKYDLAPVFFKGSLRYSFMTWLANDRWWGDRSKRRMEHVPSATGQVLWEITEHFALSLTYSYRYIFSNLGREEGDYIDYTMDRHLVTLQITGRYEGERKE